MDLRLNIIQKDVILTFLNVNILRIWLGSDLCDHSFGFGVSLAPDNFFLFIVHKFVRSENRRSVQRLN